jgi:hypothetical protein
VKSAAIVPSGFEKKNAHKSSSAQAILIIFFVLLVYGCPFTSEKIKFPDVIVSEKL